MKTIRVAAAVIEKDGKIFAAARGYGDYKGYWEFPGGKLEPGETAEEALKREIREELDAEIEVGEKLSVLEYDYPAFHLNMDVFRCRLISENVTLLEHEDAKWLPPEELGSVRWLPSDVGLIADLEKLLKKQGK